MDLAHRTPVVDETDLFPICRSMARVTKLSKRRDLIRACPRHERPIIGLSADFTPESLEKGLTSSIGASGMGATLRILFESRPLFRVHPGATNQPVIELDDGVGFLWVRE